MCHALDPIPTQVNFAEREIAARSPSGNMQLHAGLCYDDGRPEAEPALREHKAATYQARQGHKQQRHDDSGQSATSDHRHDAPFETERYFSNGAHNG
jgi:hypothetical protein